MKFLKSTLTVLIVLAHIFRVHTYTSIYVCMYVIDDNRCYMGNILWRARAHSQSNNSFVITYASIYIEFMGTAII